MRTSCYKKNFVYTMYTNNNKKMFVSRRVTYWHWLLLFVFMIDVPPTPYQGHNLFGFMIDVPPTPYQGHKLLSCKWMHTLHIHDTQALSVVTVIFTAHARVHFIIDEVLARKSSIIYQACHANNWVSGMSFRLFCSLMLLWCNK